METSNPLGPACDTVAANLMVRRHARPGRFLRNFGALVTCLCLASCGGSDQPAGEAVARTAIEAVINGCPPDSLFDATGRERVEIHFGGEVGYRYEPACLAVSPGSRVDFVGPFDAHPLAVGRIDDQGIPTLEPDSPLRATSEGSRADFPIEHPGVYGYFCDMHVGDGMFGVIVAR